MSENPFSDIEFKAERQGRNDPMPNQDGLMTHWKCTIGSERDGVVVPVSLSVSDFGERPPTFEETLGFLAADALAVQQNPDKDSWFATMNAPDDRFDDYAIAHSAIQAMMENMNRRFGPAWTASVALSAQAAQPPGAVTPA